MHINCDLHSHSGYAGGVGNISLTKIDEMMTLKGIDVVGTGDCLHPHWSAYLEDHLLEPSNGIFAVDGYTTSFLLQSEVIITCPAGNGRKTVHLILLFPSFDAIEQCVTLLDSWGVKNTIGRPFIVCEDRADVSHKLFSIQDIHPYIEIIPAHILTPDGIYGSNRPITYMNEIFGAFSAHIAAIETGLSADPGLLRLIPELSDKTWISNSDAHSPYLHRMGREFTTLDVSSLTYPSIIQAIRNGRVVRTAEFHPAEGRYFLTGHRPHRKGHGNAYCFFSPDCVPADHTCPICSKNLTVGVLERTLFLSTHQKDAGDNHPADTSIPPYINMIPLAEIVARGLGISTLTSKKVFAEYCRIVKVTRSECELWFMDEETLTDVLKGYTDDRIYQIILSIKRGEFGFSPPGFDGQYGRFVLDKTETTQGVCEVSTG
jgi:PHP family Zn ribbon phosphoesterase